MQKPTQATRASGKQRASSRQQAERTFRKDRAGGVVRLAILVAVLCGTLITFLSQQKRLAGLQQEKTQLASQLDELRLEEEKRKKMLDFTQTDDYIEQYARDKLGLVKEGDIKFVNPTPEPEAAQDAAAPQERAQDDPQAAPSPAQ